MPQRSRAGSFRGKQACRVAREGPIDPVQALPLFGRAGTVAWREGAVRVLSRPGIGEVVGSAVCLVAVLATLVAIDGRVHERFDALVTRASSDGLSTWGERAAALGGAVVQVARDRSIDQAPLLVFAAVGAALLIFMLRT